VHQRRRRLAAAVRAPIRRQRAHPALACRARGRRLPRRGVPKRPPRPRPPPPRELEGHPRHLARRLQPGDRRLRQRRRAPAPARQGQPHRALRMHGDHRGRRARRRGPARLTSRFLPRAPPLQPPQLHGAPRSGATPPTRAAGGRKPW
jgi:hypothetical protein